MVDEQNAETPEQEKKRKRRDYMRNYRRNDKPEEIEITSFEQIAESWTRNEAALLKADPTLHSQLLALHNAIAGWEAEAEEIAEGVKNRLRAETRSAETADSTEIFPCPDLSYREIRAVASNKGTANYRAIEADAVNGKGLDDESEHYKKYGFRLRLSHETLQMARENLVLYALRTKDSNLDAALVAEAISDCVSFKGFSANAAELRKLIRQYQEASVSLQNL
jgi:hypothetical protein